jgi:hypothetical protein
LSKPSRLQLRDAQRDFIGDETDVDPRAANTAPRPRLQVLPAIANLSHNLKRRDDAFCSIG